MKYEYKKLEAERLGTDERGYSLGTDYIRMEEIEELAAEGWRVISVMWDGPEIGAVMLEREKKNGHRKAIMPKSEYYRGENLKCQE